MVEEKLLDEHISGISKRLIAGENVLLIGPDRGLFAQIQARACAASENHARFYFARHEWTIACATKLIEEEIENAQRTSSTHLVVRTISPEIYLDLMDEYGQFCYFSSLPAANDFSACMQLANALQKKGINSGCTSILLENAMTGLFRISVPNSSEHPPRRGSFREKLESARYNRSKPVLTDHGSLLKGWTQEGEGCDPGWELDK